MRRTPLLLLVALLCLSFADVAKSQMILDGSGNAILTQV